MIGALTALVIVVVWFLYVAATVASIASGDATNLVGWVIATPFVIGIEWLGIQILERTAKFG